MVSVKELPAHFEKTYGVHVRTIAPLERWGPEGAQRVELDDGDKWVARPHGPERPLKEVEGDAEILRFLERHGFPAERVAHDEPVSTFGDGSVMITRLLPGKDCRSDRSPKTIHATGSLLGRLSALPLGDGAESRPGGGWHHLSQAGGGRDADVAALVPVLSKVSLPDSQHDARRKLIGELESIDLCGDLPHCLVNVDLGGPNVIKHRGKLTAVDWTGAGRGPRLQSVVGTLYHPATVDAFVAGYREHVTLEDEELDRLAGTLPIHSLILEAWGVAFRGRLPSDVLERLEAQRRAAEDVAAKVRQAFHKKDLSGWDRPAPQPVSRQDPLQALTDAIKGKTDEEIAMVARAAGGYAQLCSMVFAGMRSLLKPKDCTVGFVLGDDLGWVFKAVNGKNTVARRVPKRAPAIVHASPPDFLRIITRQLDWDAGLADGRIKVDGDPDEVATMFSTGG